MVYANQDVLKPWRAFVSCRAVEDWVGGPSEAAMSVECAFAFRRPKGHYGTGRNAGKLKTSAPKYPKGKTNDIDKLIRAVFDALTGIVYVDDGQVVDLGHTHERYAPDPGVRIVVRELLEDVS